MSATNPSPPFVWSKQAVCLPPFDLPGGQISKHCQMPTAVLVEEGTLRMFYCARNASNQSQVYFADLEPEPPFAVKMRPTVPCFENGKPGTFDASGVMPSSILQIGEELWMYYIGWTIRADVPYHNAIGLAVSTDGGRSFKRMFEGPVVGNAAREPYFCSTSDVMQVNGEWLMWYASTTGWIDLEGKMEPRYHLKLATSRNGMDWNYGQQIAVDYCNQQEAAVARATVLRDENHYHMWFCHRSLYGYRDDPSGAYSIGYAQSTDGITWQRNIDVEVFAGSGSIAGFDHTMQAYPFVCKLSSGPVMFYNGDGFGQTGIAYALPAEL